MKMYSETPSGIGINQALYESRELQSIFLDPDKITYDTSTVLSLSEDISESINSKMSFTPRYGIGQVREVFPDAINEIGASKPSLVATFGDAVVEELLVVDLLEEAQSKPLVKEFDENNILRGIILALDRDIDCNLESLWESIGMNYPTLFVAASRPSLSEEKARQFMQSTGEGENIDGSSFKTPWFLRVAMASEDQTNSIRRTLKQSNPRSEKPTFSEYDIAGNQLASTVFNDAELFMKFMKHIRRGFLSQVQGTTISNYLNNNGDLDIQTQYVEPIDSNHKFERGVMLTPSTNGDCSEGELLYSDKFTGYECRIINDAFILQRTHSFMQGTDWISINEIDKKYLSDIESIILDEKEKIVQSTRKSSIF